MNLNNLKEELEVIEKQLIENGVSEELLKRRKAIIRIIMTYEQQGA